ncbi:bifunctional diguanylate cyclase/phosphodiesterase [Citrobacter sp. OP27]
MMAISSKFKHLSLARVVTILFISSLCCVFLIFSVIAYQDKMNMLDTIIHNQIESRSDELKKSVEEYINLPRQANESILTAMRQNSNENIPMDDVRHILGHVLNDVYQSDTGLKNVQYGSKYGDFVGIDHNPKNSKLEFLTLDNDSTHHVLTSYSGMTDKSTVTMYKPHYNMKERPWFKSVNESISASWTSVFLDLDLVRQLGIAYSSPAFNKKGEFVGVVSSELYLPDLNRKLIQLKPYKKSTLLVIDSTDKIIASSEEKMTFIQNSDSSYLLSIANAPLVVKSVYNQLKKVKTSQAIKVKVEGEDYYASYFPVTDYTHQLNWKVMVIIPASEALESMNLNEKPLIIALLLVLVVSIALITWVLSHITSPLRDIAKKTRELENGQWHENNSRFQFEEIKELESGFRNLSHKLSSSFDQLRKQIELDPETGLCTRRGLLKDQRIYNKRNLVALVHVTNTKNIMNTLGYKYAEEQLKAFIKRLQDILPTDIIISRDNIDKFVIVFPGINQEKDVVKYQDLINSVFSSVRKHHANQGTHLLFSGNAGMVLQDVTPDSIIDILMHAWLALQSAESMGNATTELYSENLRASELINIQLHESLGEAIDQDEFYLVLQPIVGKDDEGTCVAGECLIRWNSKKLGVIPPDDFIPIAEESGLIITLGRWIIENACRELALLIERGAPRHFRLHINISPVQVLHQGFAWHLLDTIKLNGLSNENISIEITENVLMRDMRQAYQVLNYLRRHGISITLDDFGAGFSNLSHLHQLPFDNIKIDKQFMTGQTTNEINVSIIQSLLILAKGFNVPLIAEGVEKAEVSEQLIAMGCDLAQGFHFAYPNVFASWHCENNKFFYQRADEKVMCHDELAEVETK